ncbi:MAG: regulatory protein RecX [Microbacterium sp.]
MRGDELAPVIPLFGGAVPEAPHHREPDRPWHASWIDGGDDDSDDGRESEHDPGDPALGGDEELEAAERILLRRLRGRSLSVSEARDVVGEFDLDADAVESLLVRFQGLGYLDDVMLAEQLVHVGADRKGQGRRVIAQTMSKRGIPRDVVDAVLAELPDDDHERALEFARSKARSMSDLDRDTALRRLSGQLARRGYGGSVAMTAARAALDEVQQPKSGVRFR